jgi:NDP-sugar pyrophosphorylase family protein
MKTLLISPGRQTAVPLLNEHLPLAAVPILGEPLACHWVEHLASLGAREIRIVASDRADLVRAAVGDGARWGVQVEIIAAANEPTPAEAVARYRSPEEPGWLPPPADVVFMNHLPGRPDLPLFTSYAAWYEAIIAWMPRALTPVRVRVSEVRPGIWIGRRSRVAPTAVLQAPCWIGDQVLVGKDCVIGPGAVLEDRACIEAGAKVVQSIVGPDTYVGRLTVVASSLAGGSTLTNWRSGSSLRVPDPFLMCSLAGRTKPAPAGALKRSFQAVYRTASAPFSFLSRSSPGIPAINRH